MKRGPGKKAEWPFWVDSYGRLISFGVVRHFGSGESEESKEPPRDFVFFVGDVEREDRRIDKLQKERDQLAKKNVDLRTENARLSTSVTHSRQQSLVGFLLMLLASGLLSLGANVATDKPYGWTGWVMIGSSVLLQLIAFYMAIQQRRKR